jgi:UDP-3-O-[3-hydroxymyristoyl] N-acetylglucosamine deacetylase
LKSFLVRLENKLCDVYNAFVIKFTVSFNEDYCMIKQRTLRAEVSFSGVGVHCGILSHLLVKPAAENTGIIIQKAGETHKKIHIGKLVPEPVQYATVLQCEDWQVSTIEHVMAALIILGVDNAIIELDGQEFPILDGSSLPFVEAMLKVGFVEQNMRKYFLTPKNTLYFKDEKEGREISVSPALRGDDSKMDTSLYVEYMANFDHPALKEPCTIQCVLSGQDTQAIVSQIVPARTFGFLEQLPFLKKMGLAKGASLENTVVLNNDGYVNERRFDDECVRHKLLDLIGDLALVGHSIAGRIRAVRTGHNFNRKVVEHYVKNPDQWVLV